MTRRLLIFLTLFCLALCAQADSRTVPDLYRFSVPVDNASNEARTAALSAAMAQVLVRVTGDRKVADKPEAQGLLQQANGYMQRFSYQEKVLEQPDSAPPAGAQQAPEAEAVTPRTQLMLQGTFDGRALDAAVRKAGLPLWSAQRPPILAVFTSAADGGAVVLDAEIASAFPELMDTAKERGLLLHLPAQNSLRPADAQDADSSLLVAMTGQVQADYLLWGRLSEQSGKWLLEAQLRQGDLIVQNWRLRSREAGALLREAVHRSADLLAEQLALTAYTPGGESIVGIWVRNVASDTDYKQVQAHLARIPGIEQLSLVAVVEGALVFRANTEVDAEQLDRSIRQAGRLKADSTPAENIQSPVWTGEYEFHYRLP